ncbi:MAG: FG-GAP-like repeat-containing protein [Candidatus Sumerlaeota bacterium]|nr:FG-GAP-like repeat-containing protein [Candidatus Sumerlaeota bacterium]
MRNDFWQTRFANFFLLAAHESNRWKRCFLWAMVLMVLLISPLPAQPLFETAAFYSVKYTPVSVITGDFNGDSHLDLVVASDPPSILINKGDGTFREPVQYPAWPDASRFAAADFDGDSHLDLAITDGQSSCVVILHNNGDGTFPTSTSYPTATWPLGITVTDLNNDGHPDLAIMTGAPAISVLLNRGDGTFAPTVNLSLPYTPYPPDSVAAGDFNGDGFIDLAVPIGYFPNSVTVYVNGGLGDFPTTVVSRVSAAPDSMIAVDLDGDGRMDLAGHTSRSESFICLFGNGDATFGGFHSYHMGDGGKQTCAADFNGDGFVDLAAVSEYSQEVTVLYNDGAGTFTKTASYGVDEGPWGMATGDLNGDGAVDIVTADFRAHGVSVLLNHGDGAFAGLVNYATGHRPEAVGIADFNNDGWLDLAVPASFVSEVNVLLNRRDGTFAPGVTYKPYGYYYTSVAIADFDRDGHSDIAVALDNGLPSSLRMLHNQGDGTFTDQATSFTGMGPIATADFNGDGWPDLASADGHVAFNNQDGTFAPDMVYPVMQRSDIAAADLNGDGLADLALIDRGYSFTSHVVVLLNRGDGVFPTSTCYTAGFVPCKIIAADLDGDGRNDLALVNSPEAKLSFFHNKGDGTFDDAISTGTLTFARGLTVADLDGDGVMEIAVTAGGSPSGIPSSIAIYHRNANGTYTQGEVYRAGNLSSAIAAADLDRDGAMDLIVANYSANNISVLRNLSRLSDKVRNYLAGRGTLSPEAKQSADANSDGWIDIADLIRLILMGR